MQLTRQGEYALRTVLELADKLHKVESTKQIAINQNIPAKFLAKIVQQLSKAGIIRTQRGINGGVTLVKEPHKLSLLDVIEAVEGKIVLNECLLGKNSCERVGTCPLHSKWCNIQNKFKAELSAIKFSELIS